MSRAPPKVITERTPRLDGERILRVGDLGLAGVAVLGDEVAGETGKVVILHLAKTTFTDLDHFAGAGKVISGLIPGLTAG